MQPDEPRSTRWHSHATVTALYLPLMSGKLRMLLPPREQFETLAKHYNTGHFSFLIGNPFTSDILNQYTTHRVIFSALTTASLWGGESVRGEHMLRRTHVPQTKRSSFITDPLKQRAAADL